MCMRVCTSGGSICDLRAAKNMVFFFFFKQKTAYEMRISDWSSDVCSSDLPGWPEWQRLIYTPLRTPRHFTIMTASLLAVKNVEIGRASCRERVCQYV